MSSTLDSPGNFMDRVLAGRAYARDIEDYVEYWHEAPEDSVAAKQELHEFLGLTWDEYKLWVEKPESLRFSIAAHRANQPVNEVIRQTALAGAAARSTEHTEAAKVLQWLIERGRIKTN